MNVGEKQLEGIKGKPTGAQVEIIIDMYIIFVQVN